MAMIPLSVSPSLLYGYVSTFRLAQFTVWLCFHFLSLPGYCKAMIPLSVSPRLLYGYISTVSPSLLYGYVSTFCLSQVTVWLCFQFRPLAGNCKAMVPHLVSPRILYGYVSTFCLALVIVRRRFFVLSLSEIKTLV